MLSYFVILDYGDALSGLFLPCNLGERTFGELFFDLCSLDLYLRAYVTGFTSPTFFFSSASSLSSDSHSAS